MACGRVGAGVFHSWRYIGRVIRTIASVAAALMLVLGAAPALADWSGDAKPDVLAVGSDGALLLYRTNGAGAFVPGGGVQIGAGWAGFGSVVAPGDWTGDGKPDLMAVQTDGTLLLYRGDGDGGFLTGTAERIGTGWAGFTALLTPGDWNGDGSNDLLARRSDGALILYRGNGKGGFISPYPQVGSGWQGFTAILGAGDWSGDGKPDLLARQADGALLLYRGDGAGGFTSASQKVGSGWGGFTALFGGGDFSGDHKPDVLARKDDGTLLLYRGNGAGGFVSPYPQVGSGWGSLTDLMLLSDPPPPPAPPPAPAPPSAPVPDGRVKLTAGVRCTPPGGRLKVSLRIRKRKGHARPRVRRVVFFVHDGPRRTDRKAPYTVRLRLKRPAGSRGRVYARVVFRRPGNKQLHRKTVSRRFVICG
jgi:FG-GAP-like repeat